MWKQDPNLRLQDSENVKPSSICPGDAYFSYNYKIWITSGFLHTGEERLIPKFQDSFTFPSGTSSVLFDRNYCLTLPDSTQQCAQFCNPRTNDPELNPYWLNRYDEGRKGDPTEEASSDSFIGSKDCKKQQQELQQQPGDQTIIIPSGEDLQEQQGKALTNEDNYFPIPDAPSNYFPSAGSPIRNLFPDDLEVVDTFYDGQSAPILVDTDISVSNPPTAPGRSGIRKRTEKLRRS